MAISRNQRASLRIAPCAAFWVIALALSGCQLVFGEYKVGDGTGGSAEAAQVGGATSTGGTTAMGETWSSGGASSSGRTVSTGGSGATACNGTTPYRCQNGTLQACTSGFWITKQTCARPALCQPILGVCDACATGDRTCAGSALSDCNATHTAFTQTATCSSPLYCDVGVDYCVACAANQAHCNGDYLDICNSRRTAIILQAQSCNGLGCRVIDGMSDYCNDCSADPPQCASSTTLRFCVSGKWKASTCTTGCADATASTLAACY